MMFKRRLIPYTVPELHKKTVSIIVETIRSDEVCDGKYIKEFERKFAGYIGTKYAVSVTSGRAALYYVYKFFNISAKNVILPAYTCIPAIDPARWAGALVKFVDIDLNSYNPYFDDSIKKMNDIGAVGLCYLYGLIGEIEPFIEYAEDNNIPIVEDSAIALGASYKGRKAGNIGDAGVFSLQESKIITAWRGAVVTTNNTNIYNFLKDVQSRQVYPSKSKLIFNLFFSYLRRKCSRSNTYGLTMYPLKNIMTSKYMVSLLEKFMNFHPLEAIDGESPKKFQQRDDYKFTNIQARIALESLGKIEGIVKKRREMAKILIEELQGVPRVKFNVEQKNIKNAYGRFPIRIPGKTKFELFDYFLRRGIETSLNYPYICPNTKFFKGEKNSDYPNALTASKETLLMPFHTLLSERDLLTTANTIREAI